MIVCCAVIHISSFMGYGETSLEKQKMIAFQGSDLFVKELGIPDQSAIKILTNLVFQATDQFAVGRYRMKLDRVERKDINGFNVICTHFLIEDTDGHRIGWGRLSEASDFPLAKRELLSHISGMSNMPCELWVKHWISSTKEVGTFCLWEKKREVKANSNSADDIEYSSIYFVRGCKGVCLVLLDGKNVMPLARAFDEHLLHNFNQPDGKK